MTSELKEFYRRELPHYQPLDGRFSIIFRLAGSLPSEVVRRMKVERAKYLRSVSRDQDERLRKMKIRKYDAQYMERIQKLLDMAIMGPKYLTDPRVASVVAQAMRYWDGKAYELLAFTIMPNHVHVVVSVGGMAMNGPLPNWPFEGQTPYPLTNLIASIKKFSGREANQVLGRCGSAFWQDESFDHLIRTDEELERAIWYVLENPVQAGLTACWREWPWTYCRQGLVE